MSRGMNLEGNRYGRLLVESYSHSHNGKMWNCKCDCGCKVIVSTSHLRAQKEMISCGCLRSEMAAELSRENVHKKIIHGMSGTKLKTCFDNMLKRCYTKTTNRYDRYGGRGIKICDEWLESRKNFYDWAINSGYKEGLSIERINIDKDYCPENCTWIDTFKQQANTSRNVFYEWNGKKMHLAEICRVENSVYSVVIRRLKRGWSIDKAVNMQLGRTGKCN